MKAEQLVKQMTLEEKAVFCVGYDFWHTKALDRLGIPSVMMCDGPNGLRKQNGESDHLGLNESIPTVCYPTASAIAASFDVELARKLGETLGNECREEEISMLLGPGVNMKRSPLCGRNFEYYSEDPYVAGKMAAAYVRGIQNCGVAACVKHFAANNQETMRSCGNSSVDERTLNELYLKAFEIVVKEASPKSIMCAYNQLNGIFCAENRHLLTEILRDAWGFDGFVVTDWGAGKDGAKGIGAGLDLVMPGDNPEAVKSILDAVSDGTLKEEQVDEAVMRILRVIEWNLKNRTDMGTPEHPEAENSYHLAVSMAKECAVLLKNENNVLPISKKAKAAFIGAFAVSPRYQGSGSSHINSRYVSNALQAAEDCGCDVVFAKGYDTKKDRTDEALLQEAVEIAGQVDVAVIFAGLPDTYESEGFDRKTLDMPENQNELIEAVAAVCPKTVVVLHNGAPIAMPWLSKVQGIMEMYLAGDGVGEAAVSLLYGDENPSGKLAETFPLKLSDTPAYINFPGEDGNPEYREGVFIGYRYYDKKEMDVLFPFGYGLSYTEFEYSDLQLDKNALHDDETLDVCVTVRNTGAVSGKEIVQLYVRDVESTAIRPDRELKGFVKVDLKPGESTQVRFTLDKNSFAYYETKIHDFYVESGDFAIEIGSSSRDIRLSATVNVSATKELPIVFHAQSPIRHLLKTEKGRVFVQSIMEQWEKAMKENGGDTDNAALGEGFAEVTNTMFYEMPLSALVSFGGMTQEQLEATVQMLNA